MCHVAGVIKLIAELRAETEHMRAPPVYHKNNRTEETSTKDMSLNDNRPRQEKWYFLMHNTAIIIVCILQCSDWIEWALCHEYICRESTSACSKVHDDVRFGDVAPFSFSNRKTEIALKNAKITIFHLWITLMSTFSVFSVCRNSTNHSNWFANQFRQFYQLVWSSLWIDSKEWLIYE